MKTHYCYTCGERLLINSTMSHFDYETGKPIFIHWEYCPNKKWYAGLFFSDRHFQTQSEWRYEGL